MSIYKNLFALLSALLLLSSTALGYKSMLNLDDEEEMINSRGREGGYYSSYGARNSGYEFNGIVIWIIAIIIIIIVLAIIAAWIIIPCFLFRYFRFGGGNWGNWGDRRRGGDNGYNGQRRMYSNDQYDQEY